MLSSEYGMFGEECRHKSMKKEIVPKIEYRTARSCPAIFSFFSKQLTTEKLVFSICTIYLKRIATKKVKDP